MLELKKVAITGGLSCGKSTICRFLKDLGCYVVSADEVVHNLLNPGTALGQQVIDLLGQEIIVNSQIDRRFVAAKVFDKPEVLNQLERILHPAVLLEVQRQYEEIKHQSHHLLFVAEIPLLFEVGGEKEFDAVVAVTADPELCQQRFCHKHHEVPEAYTQRMQRQMNPKEKAAKATHVIENNGSLEDLKKATEALLQNLKER